MEKPIGKCFRCGNQLCERCVTFISGQAICSTCARDHEETIVQEVSKARRKIDIQAGGEAMPLDELTIKRRHQLRKLWRTISKCFEQACLILVAVGFIFGLVFFSHIMDFAASYALSAAATNRQNPLAKLVIAASARIDSTYRRYNPAIGHYLSFIQLYPKDENLPSYYYQVGLCFLYKKDYRLARHFITEFTQRAPDHAAHREALNKLDIIDRFLALREVSAD